MCINNFGLKVISNTVTNPQKLMFIIIANYPLARATLSETETKAGLVKYLMERGTNAIEATRQVRRLFMTREERQDEYSTLIVIAAIGILGVIGIVALVGYTWPDCTTAYNTGLAYSVCK